MKKADLTIVPDKSRTLIERLREISDGKDVALAKEILAMIRSEEDRQASKFFDEAMLACQSELPPVTRDSHNKHTNSKWAKLEKISRIVDPIIRRHKFTLSYGMTTSPLPDHYRVVCDVSNSGHTRRYEADVGMDSKGPKGEGNKSLAQGSGSSVTYARRYLKVMIFDIVIEGEDNDGNVRRAAEASAVDGVVVSRITTEQHDELVEALERLSEVRKEKPNATRLAFCGSWRIATMADLEAHNYSIAIKAIRDLIVKAK